MSKSTSAYRRLARELYESADLRIHPGAYVSHELGGAWVQAWVYVADEPDEGYPVGHAYDRDENADETADAVAA